MGLRRRTRWGIAAMFALLAVALIGYLGVGAYLTDSLSSVAPLCGTAPGGHRFDGVTPENMAYTESMLAQPVPSLAEYRMPTFENVRFPTRRDADYPSISIEGWWVPGPAPTAPAVILVHGRGSCRKDWNVMLPAGMLHRAGFAALAIDLRNEGSSTITDNRSFGGLVEYRDVIGAWDWLIASQHLAPSRIGLFGASEGAATVIIAAAAEPQAAAVWEDSGYADTEQRVEEELEERGIWFPWLIAPSGGVVAPFMTGVDIYGRSPLRAVSALAGRPLFIVHGIADSRTRVHHAQDLYDAARQAGVDAQIWLVPGADHTREMLVARDEYERRLDEFFVSALGR